MGTPQEIYCSPRSQLVAGFIGETNFIPGTVKTCDIEGYVEVTAHNVFSQGLRMPGFLKGVRDQFQTAEEKAISQARIGVLRCGVLRADPGYRHEKTKQQALEASEEEFAANVEDWESLRPAGLWFLDLQVWYEYVGVRNFTQVLRRRQQGF